ncbi:ADP-ribosylglycohydrolase family protein [Catenulispora subtropica]|uniref:ADP-ribosylation/Crystallin J1 n=1 Tax=Catenulispora subtropica TaxID=450798 RepID=A0ABN2T5T0_9ACTN
MSDFVPTPEQQRIIDEAHRRREEALRNPSGRPATQRDSGFALGLTADGHLQPGGGRPIAPPDPRTPLVPSQQIRADRAAGALIGAACGDALGVPYEFQPRLGDDQLPVMRGGGLGPYAPGEYSDDTQMQVIIAQVAATGLALDEDNAQRAIAEGFIGWVASGASDIGAQTRRVLYTARMERGDALTAIRAASRELHQQTGLSAGNGSLMRTGVVGLGFLNGTDAVYRCRDAARAISSLTHYDALAGDACVLWSEGVRKAVLASGPSLWRFGGVRDAVHLLPAERQAQWRAWLDEAQEKPPHAFQPNGFVVPALQAAWSAIYHTRIPDRPEDHFRLALEAAVRAGDDTDTVAAIAGVLLGAAWGRAAIPAEWQRTVHGWPGLNADGLASLATRIIG